MTSQAPLPIPGHEPPLTIEEAAAFLNVTERWVRRAIYESRLPYYKLGHHVRLAVEDLRAYLASAKVAPVAERPILARATLAFRPSGVPGGTRRPGDRQARRTGRPPTGGAGRPVS